MKETKKQPKKQNSNIELVIVLDRSGSMSAIKSDMECALNDYIKDQKKKFPQTKFTLAQFDDVYEVVYSRVDITKIKEAHLNPRGCTALFDAIGKTINNTKAQIEQDKSKPQVLFVIITDGMENASKEYTRDQVFKLIDENKNNNWDFVFLGANQDAINTGSTIGITAGKSFTYRATSKGVTGMSASLCCYTQNLRASDDNDSIGFTDKDREEQENS